MDRTDAALLVIRVAIGLTMLAHAGNHAFGSGGLAGTTRWFGSLGMRQPRLQAVLSAVIEAAAGVGIAAGFLTSIAAGALVGIMLVAGVAAHRKNGFFVFRDGYEYVLMIALAATAVAVAGPGRFSVDFALGLSRQLSGWTGLLLVVVLGVGGAIVQLTAFWRPDRPAPAEAVAGDR